MATTRAYLIPGQGYINEVKGNAYLIPGWGYVNETVSSTPPPTNSPYISGTNMLQVGTTIITGTSPKLWKGTVQDNLNLIPQ